MKTVEIKVRMDCEGCERKVKKSVEGMKGVTQVEVNPKLHKLTVMGYLDPNKVFIGSGTELERKLSFGLMFHTTLLST